MTDCFIMIHVIIFFVGVTDMLSGVRCVWFGQWCWYPKRFRGGTCAPWVFVGLGCVSRITVYNSRWVFWVFFFLGGGLLLSVWGTAEPDPAAKKCHSSELGCRHSLTPAAKTDPNWAIIHIQVPAICKYRAWGVHSTFLHWADLGFQPKQETQFSSFLKALFECYTY